MVLLRSTHRLLAAVHSYYANRRRDALLRDCDPRMLKDIGLRWERGKLVPIHPEAFTAGISPIAGESMREICPHCGSRLT